MNQMSISMWRNSQSRNVYRIHFRITFVTYLTVPGLTVKALNPVILSVAGTVLHSAVTIIHAIVFLMVLLFLTWQFLIRFRL
jgi:hypothetical protein